MLFSDPTALAACSKVIILLTVLFKWFTTIWLHQQGYSLVYNYAGIFDVSQADSACASLK